MSSLSLEGRHNDAFLGGTKRIHNRTNRRRCDERLVDEAHDVAVGMERFGGAYSALNRREHPFQIPLVERDLYPFPLKQRRKQFFDSISCKPQHDNHLFEGALLKMEETLFQCSPLAEGKKRLRRAHSLGCPGGKKNPYKAFSFFHRLIMT